MRPISGRARRGRAWPGRCWVRRWRCEVLAVSLRRWRRSTPPRRSAAARLSAGKGCLMLTLGDFEHGLEGYEARWLKGKSLAEALGTRFETWRGPGRRGERVLVLNDHGLGDTIQFFRYLPLMAAAGVDATFVCPPRLAGFCHRRPAARFVDRPPEGEPFDAQIAISSLPLRFRHAARDDSGRGPLSRGRAGVCATDGLSASAPEGFKIGVVWQGNPDPEADRARSMPLAAPGAARRNRGREAHFPAEGLRRRAAGEPAAFDAGRDAGRGFRRRRRRLRRHGGGDDLPRSRRHLRHFDRPSRRGSRCSGLGRVEERRGMALADRTRRFALVSDHASLSSVAPRRLARRVRGHGARTRPLSKRRAPRRTCWRRRARSAN